MFKSKEKLSIFLKSLNADFDIISFEQEILFNSKVKSLYQLCNSCHDARSTKLGVDCYLKILTPLMHQYLTKLLYLDVDIIFNGSIDYIFKKESLHSLAAVPDKVLKNFRIGFKYVNELKLHPGSSYLNSGVLLFDIPSWNNQNLTKKILDNGLKNIHLLEGSGGGFAADQPCINFTIQGNWYDLGRESNFPADTFNPKAKIIHFIGNAKPWLPGCHIDYANSFYLYLKNSPWSTWKKVNLITSSRRITSSLLQIFLTK